MTSNAFGSLYAAVATPLGSNGRPDIVRLKNHCRWVIDHGVHGVCPFGTTGEGVSYSVHERKEALLCLAEAFAPSSLMPVIGACSLDDAASLVAFATSIGCRGTLLLPPFYFKQPSNEGIYDFYCQVIERVNDYRLRLFVYNIPQVTGVQISHSVVDRLVQDYGEVIAGIKDSCGDLGTTEQYCARYPNLAVLTGTDDHIVASMLAGGAGTITGMGNINPASLRSIVEGYATPEAIDQCAVAGKLHRIVEKYGGVPAIKAVLAHYLDDPDWSELAPPLVRLSPDQVKSLIANLEAGGYRWPR